MAVSVSSGMELLSVEGFRIDGRRSGELRQIRARLGVFKQSDGSAYIEQGNTKVLAAVYGPHEVSGRSGGDQTTAVINCQYSMTTFSTGERRNRPRGDRKSTEISSQLIETFQSVVLTELFPRCQIDIYFEVLEADGSNFSACVNAATLALIDAGVALRDYPCSCTAIFSANTALIDASNLEESSASPELTVAILPRSEEIVFLQLNSKIHESELNSLLDSAMKGCKDIFKILDENVKEHVSSCLSHLEQQ